MTLIVRDATGRIIGHGNAEDFHMTLDSQPNAVVDLDRVMPILTGFLRRVYQQTGVRAVCRLQTPRYGTGLPATIDVTFSRTGQDEARAEIRIEQPERFPRWCDLEAEAIRQLGALLKAQMGWDDRIPLPGDTGPLTGEIRSLSALETPERPRNNYADVDEAPKPGDTFYGAYIF